MPPRSKAGPSYSSFCCRYPGCRATYQRKEHLNRHAAQHGQAKRFSCPHCDSILARSDLLRRHVYKYHPERELPLSRAQQACRACHTRKERCDGGSPCNPCQKRKLACSRTHQITDQHDERKSPDTQSLFNNVPGASRWVAQDFIDIYFREFHPNWPFLHRGTFKLEKEPCILLQSMLMMGLWIRGDQVARDTAMTFHRKLLSAIHDQRDQWYIPEPTPTRNDDSNDNHTSCPMATYQSIIIQLIFALLIAKHEMTLDLNLRYQLPAPQYDLLTALVATCRRRGMFSYPTMLAQQDADAPIALIWVSVEEVKRFGLALYKICRLCSREEKDGRVSTHRDGSSVSELLTLADLDFCLPDSDAAWEASSASGAEDGSLRRLAAGQPCRDNRDPEGWISRTSGRLCDAGLGFDWI
ncbi:Zn(II)2Cys6 transcription factor [Aspergillus ibericus CBS 121593]|uniref:C6 and C2H2 transcription factor n=1 Tax=Aspergillus ibericus CBS 121593 TaxID=1448316 RepID=A0A395GXF0_9EURO|nr:C6 and C2H2 transcription factor [Aspergillus ibericus CBS 121593]RAK98733.1 C6 and C2H2 transcription factor [Aspergillus ibericus CBS 121593]